MKKSQINSPKLAPQGLTYGGYLRLDELLSCQSPRSNAHDELLFIVIHQASELWMKLCLHELGAARAAIMVDDIGSAMKMMARVGRVQAQLIQSWEVLVTITPADYSAMRAGLGGSSGFQSYQYRMMEFMMGNKNARMIDVHGTMPQVQETLREALGQSSLYDEALRLLARRGLPVPSDHVDRDFTQNYQASPGVEACWAIVYQNPKTYWDLYDLAEKLVDLEYRFQIWRFNHLKAVERVIGFKRGTGGSDGVPYLAKMIKHVFFPELLSVRLAL
jgi:tryptophan 2,3-dioxygenase